MTDVYVSTQWHVTAGREDEFVETWREALTWTKQTYGDAAERARLLRDDEDGRHFTSFIEWADAASRDRWFKDPGFEPRISALRALCDDSKTATYGEAAKVG